MLTYLRRSCGDEAGKGEMKARKVAHRNAKRECLFPNYKLG
jgi:hypothetical protein